MQAAQALIELLTFDGKANSDAILERHLKKWVKHFSVTQDSLHGIELQLIGKLMHSIKTKRFSAEMVNHRLTQYLVCSDLENSSALFAFSHSCTLIVDTKRSDIDQAFKQSKDLLTGQLSQHYDSESVHFSDKYRNTAKTVNG